jgi:hypothetical protein
VDQDDQLKGRADEAVLEILRDVIKQAYEQSKEDEVSRALLYLLVRVSNTWRSIRTLDQHTTDEEGPMLDAGALLRAMFDAYLQAEYIVSDPSMARSRANDYLDFEHVERYKRAHKVISYDNPFANQLKSSPRRPEGEQRLQMEYDRVKHRFLVEKRKSDGTIKQGPGTRTNWYLGSLADIARSLGKIDEYDILLATFHGCVHSSALAVRKGPTVSREHILDWASTIAARVAQLSVRHNDLKISDFHAKILAALCKPYF